MSEIELVYNLNYSESETYKELENWTKEDYYNLEISRNLVFKKINNEE